MHKEMAQDAKTQSSLHPPSPGMRAQGAKVNYCKSLPSFSPCCWKLLSAYPEGTGGTENTGYALACAAAHSLARVLATAAGGVARERARICAEAISADLHSNAVSGPSTRERGFLPRSRAWTCPRWTGTGALLSYGSPVVRCAALPGETAAQIFETRTKQHIFPSFLCLEILQRWSFFLSFAVFQNTVRWEASTW